MQPDNSRNVGWDDSKSTDSPAILLAVSGIPPPSLVNQQKVNRATFFFSDTVGVRLPCCSIGAHLKRIGYQFVHSTGSCGRK